ncbi:MAG: glycine cleavage system protein R, partial [Rhodocyclaceae bacterium]
AGKPRSCRGRLLLGARLAREGIRRFNAVTTLAYTSLSITKEGCAMDHLVLTVFAPDKPGQVERIAQCIAEHGGNWLESRMSRMAGQFAGILRVGVPAEAYDSLVDALQGLSSHGIRVLIAESGIETPDTPIIELCRATAQRIGRIFEQAVTRNEISMADLFDERYRPVAGSNPLQHMTRFVALTDRLLPEVQEPILPFDPRIAFCAALDRNGYLPTHNQIYSKPQGDDPVWNSANCRNRRIFDDRTGLSAGRSTRSFLLQTYRRDMGGGNFVLMKDVSAPISVKGRHWGGFRIGFRV